MGHAAVSVLAGQASRRLPLWALVLGGVLPDADYVFFHFDFFLGIHRVVTHNLAFAFGAALLAAGIARREKGWAALAAFAGVALHCLADSMLDTNAANGIGVALLWPFTDWMFSPYNFLTPNPETALPESFWAHGLRAARDSLWEIPVWLLGGWLWFRRWKMPVSREGETHARGMV